MARISIVFVALLSLSGCTFFTTGPGMVVASLTTLSTTKKTPTDHVVSWLTGEECSAVKMSQGQDYCQPKAGVLDREALASLDGGEGSGPFCYRTLGEVTCYSRPDPLASEYARLD